MPTGDRQAARLVNEAGLQSFIIELALRTGWRVFHPKKVQVQGKYWFTAQEGHVGYPDLTLAHTEHGLIFAELKAGRNKLTEDQMIWREVLEACGAEFHVWRPADQDQIVKRLKGQK